MVKTLDSSSTLFCPVSEFLKRVDSTSVGQLASDTGTPIASGSLATNANVLAALGDACGEVESAAYMGERYAKADLELIAATDCHAQKKLYRICSDLAWVFLWERRPNKDLRPPPSLDRSLAWLEQLAQGTRIFGLLEVEEASVLDHQTMTAAEVENRNGVTYQAQRFFGRRSDRESPPTVTG